MGFLSQTELDGGNSGGGGLAPQGEQPLRLDYDPDFFKQTLPAAFDLSNSAKNFADWGARKMDRAISTPYDIPTDPTFNPYEDIKGYEDYSDAFIDARNSHDVMRTKDQIDKELEAKNVLSESGGMGYAALLAAGIMDPINLIPFGAGAKAAKGGRLLASLSEGAKAGFLTGVAVEPLLQGNQVTRDWKEGAFDIASQTILSGIIGTGGGALAELAGKSGRRGMAESLADIDARLDADLTLPRDRDPLVPGFVEQSEAALMLDTDPDLAFGSVGAAARVDTNLAQETLKSALGAEKATAWLNPLMRTSTSPNIETRRIGQELMEGPLRYQKNAEGIASPIAVETKIKGWMAKLADAITGLDRSFVAYRTGKSELQFGDLAKIAFSDMLNKSKAKLDYHAFKEEVGRAMRRDDTHEIPEVAQAAAHVRKTLIEPLKQKAIAAGLLPEDVKVSTAASYITRVYNVDKIIARRTEFEGRVTAWLRDQQGTAAARMSEIAAKVPALQKAVDDLRVKLAELHGLAVKDETGKTGTVTESRQGYKAARFEVTAKERDLVAAKKELARSGRAVEAAAKRAERFRPDEATADNPLREVIRDLKNGVKEPPSLTDWVRAKKRGKSGGIRDDGGDVLHMVGTKKNGGLINNKSGQNLDDLALWAWEDGYFAGHEERPTINEFLDALNGDVNKWAKVYRLEDEPIVEYKAALDDWSRHFEDIGVDVSKMSEDEVIKRVEKAGGDPEDFRFREATPAAKAQSREIDLVRRQGEKRHGKASEAAIKAEKDLIVAEAARDEARLNHQALVAEAANTVGAHSKAQAALDRATRSHESERGLVGADDAELRDAARQITDNLTGGAPGRIGYMPVPLARGPLKERVFNIQDEKIEDFLENDIEHIARVYHRTMSADVELATQFGRADMTGQLDTIRERYAQIRKGVTDEKKLRRIDAKMKSDLEDISAVRDRLRGTYAMPNNPGGLTVRASRFVRNWNYLRLMGGMTLSALPDLGRGVMLHGLQRVAGAGLLPLISNLQGYKLAAREVELAGTALDMVLDNRAMQLADIWDEYGKLSKFERGVASTVNRYGLVSLMAPWNAALKKFVGVVTQSRMLDAISQGRKATAAERERLAMLGIDSEMADRIAAQFNAHGERQAGGVMWANTEAWADGAAVDAFRGALVKDVDTAIVSPGAGDKPLWMSTPLGQIVGQFKSFSFASTQRVALAGLQQRDAAALNGVLLSVSLGMVSYGIATNLAGRDTSDSPAKWIGEGFDRSGVLGIMSDVMNLGARTFGVGWSGSRYASRSNIEMFLGPTAGLVNDSLGVLGAGGDGQWSNQETKSVRRLLPFQNLFYLRWLFDTAEHGLNQAAGLPVEG